MSPHFESPENPAPSELEVIEALQTRGREDDDAMELLDRWTARNEAEADRLDTTQARAECIIKQAKLYDKLGWHTEAFDSLEEARKMAFNEHDMDLFDRIMSLMERIDEGKSIEE